MIDLHCHILPGLDDGAQDLQEALDMARIAVQDGITDI
ncbi:MAG: CpsB/CapC family capsule biosynthesis tyrosine phosphatase, partial [Tumebacillaceae bacterium]